MIALTRPVEWCWVLGACVLLHLHFGALQPVNDRHGGLMYDGQHYFEMARQTPRRLPPEGAAPFVYRIGAPMAVAAVAKPLDWVLAAGFDRLNVAASVFTVVLMTVWLRRHAEHAWTRILVVIFFMVEPHSPMRFSYYYPISVDALALSLIMTGVVVLDGFVLRPTPGRTLALSVIAAAGAAVREVTLVVGMMTLVVSIAKGPRLWRLGLWPLVVGVAVTVAVRFWSVAVETPSHYSVLSEMLRWSREKSVVTYVLAWFLVFGPLFTLVLAMARDRARELRARPDWAVGLVGLALAALLGGSDTERLLVFASPFVYLLMARSLASIERSLVPASLVIFILAQLASSRVFVSIGGLPTPPNVVGTEWNRLPGAIAWVGTYDSLWTQFSGPGANRAYLAWYGAWAIALVACLRIGGNQRLDS